ncbi:conserved hypothetical protein [Vibrio nigripulchritudo SO65]|uniref:imm11 family protein n=1 Tax=Vibrio nigripulchritudo TaxID=28173 RepID=UPI0003B20B21|nr:DUF1629 domain-containing protein [Vibrio nigripulchritudo]CCN33789.1 conserved hypothetical protein [Vibrio nigripulchritudo AM115]CCN44883.1 conserved hypothetical protein [Vibrio nigripulchritudo FTn2]CCN65694.1 conserved hypothetical protein [Vibrio nigripulchritudo POn4]CCN76259.1 conserved hypothetical protein [Vibrio nigripulchritudo SO65]
MYFDLQDFYFKDVCFNYSDNNEVDYVDALNGKISQGKELIYEIEKIDNNINEYDILPTIGLPLVSRNLISVFSEFLEKDIVTFPAKIIDESGNSNSDFSALFVINSYECVDTERSEIKYKKYRSGTQSMRIIDLYIDTKKIGNSPIFRIKEKNGYIIINQNIKDMCSNLKGLEFKKVKS